MVEKPLKGRHQWLVDPSVTTYNLIPYALCTSGANSHSLDIPTPKHFCRRQYWQRFLVTLLMMQFLSRWHVYTMFFWMLRRKKPCGDTQTGSWKEAINLILLLHSSAELLLPLDTTMSQQAALQCVRGVIFSLAERERVGGSLLGAPQSFKCWIWAQKLTGGGKRQQRKWGYQTVRLPVTNGWITEHSELDKVTLSISGSPKALIKECCHGNWCSGQISLAVIQFFSVEEIKVNKSK